MNLYDSNMEALKIKDGYLYDKVRSVFVDRDVYELVKAKNGFFTIKVSYCDDMKSIEFFIHSKYDPIKEAENFANTQFLSKANINILYGFGLGYHVEKMLERLGCDDFLYIIDLNLAMFKLALEAKDLRTLLSDPRVILKISDDEKHIAGSLRGMFTEDNKFCIFVPSVKAIPPQYNNFKFILEDWNIKKSLTDKWVDLLGENYEENKKLKCENISVLFNKYKNVPVVIVSAGPSLNKNKHLLHQLKGKALIFSVGSALKPLLQAGVEPDLFCIIDPQPITFHQIEGYEDLNIPLVFLDTASSYTISRYKGPKYVACNNPVHLEGGDGLIDSGGSVATAILDMAIKFGGSPIVFVGQDLAFTNDRHHAIGDMYGEAEEVKSLPNMRKVKGQAGEVLNTSLGLLSFKHWIENKIIDNRHIEFINATEGGAFIDGCRHMTLSGFIDEYSEKYVSTNKTMIVVPSGKSMFISDQLGNCDANTVFIFMGLDKPDDIKDYCKYLKSTNKIIMVEPDVEKRNRILAFGGFGDLSEYESIKMVLGEEIEVFKKEVSQVVSIENCNNIRVYRNYTDTSRFRQYFKDVEAALAAHVEQMKMHVNTIRLLEEKINRNIFDNLPHIIKGSPINGLKNAYKDIPAIIVSAGPSLEKNIRELKDVKGNAVIMAGVRTLKPLIECGITPHFILNIDPNDIAFELTGECIKGSIPLITIMQGNNKIIEEHRGLKIFIGDENYNPFIEHLIGNRLDSVQVGGSVANASLGMAYYMGCDPIIFVGQDLAYTDYKKHSDIASLDIEENAVGDQNTDLLTVKDVYGKDIKTGHSLYYFLQWFVDFIKEHTDRLYIDATEGGARIEGTDIRTLKDAISEYCSNPLYREPITGQAAGEKSPEANIIAVVNKLKNVKLKLAEMESSIIGNIELSGELYEYYTGKTHKDINLILSKMDEYDEVVNSHEYENTLLQHSMRQLMLDIAAGYTERLLETDEEANMRIAKKNIKIYEAKHSAIQKIIEYIDMTIKRFEDII